MTTQKKPVAKPKGIIATKRAASRKRAAENTAGMAKARSIKVADEMAAGKRNMPEEEHVELPANATPLDVLIMAMRRAYVLGGSIAAAQYAEKAAPYLHAKISSVELKNPLGGAGSGADAGKPIPFKVTFVDPPKPEESGDA